MKSELYKNLIVSPDKAWQNKAKANLLEFANNNVTESGKKRNRLHILFFNFANMQINSRVLVMATSAFAILGLATFAVISAAHSAKPGDFLYGIDKAYESFQRSLITDNTKREEFESEILNERKSELDEINKDDDNYEEALKEYNEQEDRVREFSDDESEDENESDDQEDDSNEVENEVEDEFEDVNEDGSSDDSSSDDNESDNNSSKDENDEDDDSKDDEDEVDDKDEPEDD